MPFNLCNGHNPYFHHKYSMKEVLAPVEYCQLISGSLCPNSFRSLFSLNVLTAFIASVSVATNISLILIEGAIRNEHCSKKQVKSYRFQADVAVLL